MSSARTQGIGQRRKKRGLIGTNKSRGVKIGNPWREVGLSRSQLGPNLGLICAQPVPVEPNKPSLAQCGGIWRRNWAEDRTQDKTQDKPNLLKVVARFRDQTGPQNWNQTGRNYGTLSHVQSGAAWEPLATVSHLYQFGPNGNTTWGTKRRR